MKRNINQNIVLFDVDDTLVSFDFIEGIEPLVLNNGFFKHIIYPMQQHVEKIKQHKIRGHYIRVHSQGGVEWAEMIVKALGLEQYVDDVECKPKWYYDDLDANSWMHRFYYGSVK